VTAELDTLPCVLLVTQSGPQEQPARLCEYSSFALEGGSITNAVLRRAEKGVCNSDVLNMQFTSGKRSPAISKIYLLTYTGTTGAPKAAMLTHR
jgi:long-subunit acyl-CoA synthetase (AMP-forming)